MSINTEPRQWKRAVLILTLVLAAQAAVFHSRSRAESTPPSAPLASFPQQLEEWSMIGPEGVVEKEVRDVLQADDLLTRQYGRTTGADRFASLFVAYFHTQRTGKAPHSPKNCLPGSGWTPTESDIVALPVANGSLMVNRYVVSKGDQKSVVLYWYQTPHRTVASEYWAKAYLVADAIRFNRSDTALVRVVTPVNGDLAAATEAAQTLAQAVYPVMTRHLPQ